MSNNHGFKTEESSAVKLVPLWSVFLWNDKQNTFRYALWSVEQTFPQLSQFDVLTVVLTAHCSGIALCQTAISFELAEHKRDTLRGLGFTSTIAPVE